MYNYYNWCICVALNLWKKISSYAEHFCKLLLIEGAQSINKWRRMNTLFGMAEQKRDHKLHTFCQYPLIHGPHLQNNCFNYCSLFHYAKINNSYFYFALIKRSLPLNEFFMIFKKWIRGKHESKSFLKKYQQTINWNLRKRKRQQKEKRYKNMQIISICLSRFNILFFAFKEKTFGNWIDVLF